MAGAGLRRRRSHPAERHVACSAIVIPPAYAATIGQAVDFVRSRANVPVWLVGTSQGATAAVGGGARLGGKVAGIVVASSVTGRSSSGETLFDSEPGLVAVPALIVANTGDTCPASPPGDAPKIAAALAHAPRKEIVYMQSAAIEGQPCEGVAARLFRDRGGDGGAYRGVDRRCNRPVTAAGDQRG